MLIGIRIVFPVTHRLVTVDAGAERTITGTGEHDAPNGVVVARVAPDRLEFELHPEVERVQNLRTIERDPGDTVAYFVGDGLELGEVDVGHGRIVLSAARTRHLRLHDPRWSE